MIDAADILDYDARHAIESDAYACFENKRLNATDAGRYTIGVTFLQHDTRFVDAREARVLAAQLIAAAEADDAARGVCTRG